MTLAQAQTLRRRWGQASIALVVAAFILDALPIDDYFPVRAAAGEWRR